MCSCDQLRKLVAKVRPVGRMRLEPCIGNSHHATLSQFLRPLNPQVNKDFKTLKRQSQAILPLIPEMPENFSILNLDPEADPSSETIPEEESSEDLLLMSQNQIRGSLISK